MKDSREQWRFMALRAAQLFEEGECEKALKLMRLINREQEKRFCALMNENVPKKIVSTR